MKKLHTIAFILSILSLSYLVYLFFKDIEPCFSTFFIILYSSIIIASKCKKIYKMKIFQKFFKFFSIAFILWIVSFLFVVSIIISNTDSNPHEKADCIIILGGGIKENKPSPALLERLKTGIEYSKKFPQLKIILSGGMNIKENTTEADVMSNYLIANGINKTRILLEKNSTSTMENFVFSKSLLNKKNIKYQKVMIVTSDFHMFRSILLAKYNKFDFYKICSPTPKYIIPIVYIREYFAIFKSIIYDIKFMIK